jgi:hypothetical protein
MTLAAAVLAAGAAQGVGEPGAGPGSPDGRGPRQRPGKQEAPKQEKTTVSGVLGIAKGQIVLQAGEALYFVPGLERYVGFIDTLKDGAQASVEGYLRPFPEGKEAAGGFIRVSKLSIAGKDYDLEGLSPFGGPEAGPPAEGPGFGNKRSDAPAGPRERNRRQRR